VNPILSYNGWAPLKKYGLEAFEFIVVEFVAVMAYFDSHKLLTHKHASYLLWKEVGAAIERGEHLEPTSRALLRAKASTINPTG